MHGRDGLDAIDTLMANTRNNPIEEMELNAPLICERYELRDEAPAPGQWRGGLGAIKRWRFLAETSAISTGDNRSVDPPRGLFGGKDGRAGSVHLNQGAEKAEILPAKISNHRFRAGDRLEITLVSGAGYGSPFKREPGLVLADVLDGLLSSAEAKSDYGVIIAADGNSIDEKATAEYRSGKANQA